MVYMLEFAVVFFGVLGVWWTVKRPKTTGAVGSMYDGQRHAEPIRSSGSELLKSLGTRADSLTTRLLQEYPDHPDIVAWRSAYLRQVNGGVDFGTLQAADKLFRQFVYQASPDIVGDINQWLATFHAYKRGDRR